MWTAEYLLNDRSTDREREREKIQIDKTKSTEVLFNFLAYGQSEEFVAGRRVCSNAFVRREHLLPWPLG